MKSLLIMFITINGYGGSGKSTLARQLFDGLVHLDQFELNSFPSRPIESYQVLSDNNAT